ncbi:MAG: TonB-dependent receptor [Bacteroidales bacterium]|nr:TonB-dependent receptor [Bacteroidales bacterium]
MKNLTCKISFLILGLFLTAFAADAQQISGVVTDSQTQPLIGVSVFVDGTTLGVSTDIDGKYSIDIPDAKGKTLVFSCIGMATKYVVISNSNVIDVVLEEDANFLDETVVIGYATVKRRDLMGSVTSVGNEALTAVPVASVSEALTGKMAGVQVTTTEGDPDAEIKIRVRGAGSITQDSSPLYIVDGFPVESISDIPASDIQSIDVLKDAFSTAIYGSRGANGVVLVTTKSAASGKISVSYNAYWGQKKMANGDALQSLDSYEYVKAQYELAAMTDKIEDRYEQYFGKFQDIDLYENVPANNWKNEIFGNIGSTFNHNISISGSGDKVKWTAGYASVTDNAIMTASNYRRDNLNFKTQYKPIKQITVDVNARYSRTVIYGAGANSLNDGGGSTSGSQGRLKHAIAYRPFPITGAAVDTDLPEDYSDNAPPLQSVYDNDNRKFRTNWTVNGAITWHIIKNLNLRVEGGLDDYTQENNRFFGLTSYYVTDKATYKGQPATSNSNTFRTKYRSTNTLNYNFAEVFTDDRHKLDMLLGAEYILTKSNRMSTTIENFPEFFDSSMAWNFMASGIPIAANNYYDPNDQLLSFFGRVNYDFDGRYALSATMRADGSSKFTVGNQWGFFPSAAASWTISNESWLEDATWLDNLKLRYSYGTAGNNNIPQGVTQQMFQASQTTWLATGGIYWKPVEADGNSTMANPDLTWETTISHNVGLDFSFFRSRINGSVELYNNTTKDLLLHFTTKGTGYNYMYKNAGSLRNRGIEASLNFVLVEKKNFGLTLGGNVSFNQNEVTDLGGLPDGIKSTSNWASSEILFDYFVTEGRPLGDMFGYQSDGMYTVDDFTFDGTKWVPNEGVVDAKDVLGGDSYFRPGAMKFKDQLTVDSDDDGILDSGDGVINGDDMTVIGNAQPLAIGGFNLQGYLYGFDFSANFNFVLGNNIYNANKIDFTQSRNKTLRNYITDVASDKRWTNVDWNTGEVITDPDQLAAVNANATMWSPATSKAIFSDWAVEDGSFLRLTSATIGYTLPQKWTMKIKMQKLRVYVSGTNLFCLTNYSGFDPEVDTRRATPLTPGVDYSAYPKSRGYVVGVNITF